MLGPISATEVAKTSMKPSDPAFKAVPVTGSSMRPSSRNGLRVPARARNFVRACGVGPGMTSTFSRAPAGAAACLALLAVATGRPAFARDFVQDQAGMFSAATAAQLNTRIGNFNTQTGKEIVVLTTPSLGGATLQGAAAAAFAQQNVNGVLVFIARDDRRDIIVPDRAGAQAGWFTPDVLRSIRTSMESQFRSESYDAGITGAVDAILNVYRSHLGTLRQPGGSAAVPMGRSVSSPGGFRISMFWWIIIAVVGFLILRSILRAFAAPRYYGGGPGVPPGGVAPGGVPPGAPGYGPGYGYGGYGGGGSFWSGLLGGL
ncbi:MAG: TPM domain-containing protein, partial [Candidatus Eremiobacteraeota bacterium]|nr:TPM domain-containing protein [Candidatus Eremiobacteraeota bacterium]